ncbi:MAG: zinc-binding dehydrogenase [Gemmatimonadaceae bacterium]
MKALTITSHGTLDQLVLRDDLPVPPLVRPTDVRVRITAAALNHLDLWVLRGMPGVTITPPWPMGADGSGTIDAVGDSVRSVARGDTVIINPGFSDRTCDYCLEGEQPLCPRFGILGEHAPGTIAEYVVVPETSVRTIPAGRISAEEAAAFTLATLTAWRMIVTKAAIQQGERVLIWGIGGGVALAALQIAKLRGARVWVTSGSDEKLARARTLGADETINHRTTDVAKFVRDRTDKRGVDVVIDSVGEATWKQSLASLGRRGRLVTCGGTSGAMVETDVRRLFWNQWHIMGSTMGNDAELDAIVAELRAGRLLPPIDTVYPLAEGRAAFERLAAGQQFGKIVIRVA